MRIKKKKVKGSYVRRKSSITEGERILREKEEPTLSSTYKDHIDGA